MKRFSFFLLALLAIAGCSQNDNSTSTGNNPPIISAITPAEVLRGQTVDGRIQGSNLNGVLSVDLGAGLQLISITSAVNQEIGVRFFVNNDAAPGPRTVTVRTTNGETSAGTMTTRKPLAPRFLAMKLEQTLSEMFRCQEKSGVRMQLLSRFYESLSMFFAVRY